ncbi:hypothetical protein [Bradyrhizobium neotropicale]|uniref:hypothetical protein n=1 Tax=Bradyrhizobium neotropicale TaxID=1497615 RepID=UPI001FEF9D7D|nr:hypothetical protein [Bradyrhizobium neotropicale]
MAYRIGIAQGYAVRDAAVACDEAVRNAGLTMIAVLAAGVGVGGVGLEAARAVTASRVRRGMERVKASTTKTTRGMEAATMKTANGTKATASVETAAANMETTTSATAETATASTVETTTSAATARLGYVCEREPHDRARKDRSECQRDLFAAPSSQHIFLHLN